MLHYHYVLMDVAFFSCFLTTGDFCFLSLLAARAISRGVDD